MTSETNESKKWNPQHSAVKRLMSEYLEFQRNPSNDFVAAPIDGNLFEWHFTIRGSPDTPFEGGLYHGRIVLPEEYPQKPPDIMLLSPSGRFTVNEKICLSISSHHPETWSPLWGVKTILKALIAFMPQEAKGLGSLDYPDDIRRKIAKESVNWSCNVCGKKNCEILPIQEKKNDKDSEEKNEKKNDFEEDVDDSKSEKKEEKFEEITKVEEVIPETPPSQNENITNEQSNQETNLTNQTNNEEETQPTLRNRRNTTNEEEPIREEPIREENIINPSTNTTRLNQTRSSIPICSCVGIVLTFINVLIVILFLCIQAILVRKTFA